MIYTRKCAYSKCGETFQSVAVSAKYCCPSHRTLSWMENQTQSENQTPIEKTKDMDKKELREFLREEKEQEEIEKLKLKHPELIAQVEKDAKVIEGLHQQQKELLEQVKKDDVLISELQNKIIELETEIKEYTEERKEKHRKCKEDPEEYFATKHRHFQQHLLLKEKYRRHNAGEPESEPEEIEVEDVYLEYRRRTVLSVLLFGGSWRDHHCEIVKCKSTDLIHEKQLLKDGFVRSDSVIKKYTILRKN